MPSLRKIRLSLQKRPVIVAQKIEAGKNKLVYLLLADKKCKYPNGWSRVVYIGTTKNGISRVAQSVAARSEAILKMRGVDSYEARIVTCKPRKGVKTWDKLERAFLLRFKIKYGDIPICNTQGKNMRVTDEFSYFSEGGVDTVLRELE